MQQRLEQADQESLVVDCVSQKRIKRVIRDAIERSIASLITSFISSTIDDRRRAGLRPSRSGARKAAMATSSKPENVYLQRTSANFPHSSRENKRACRSCNTSELYKHEYCSYHLLFVHIHIMSKAIHK